MKERFAATRAKAVEILVAVETGGAHSSALLQRASKIPAVHFPLLQRLVKGALQWREQLDAEWRKISDKRLDELTPAQRNLIRIALYQLLHLEKVDRRLVLSETSQIARSIDGRFAKHLAAILLGISKAGGRRAGHSKEASTVSEIAREYSHPEWLIRRWIDQWGTDETIQLCLANNRAWPVCVRVNSLKATASEVERSLRRAGATLERCKVVANCYRITRMPKGKRLDDLEAFHFGLVQVQDESSCLMGLLLQPRPGESVVDLCAAPGGKAVHMAALMENRGRILAVDIHESKLKLIKENCQRQGVKIVRLKRADARNLKLNMLADKVLLDAPCSGLGILGRKVDVRWAKSEKVIHELAVLQLELLRNAASLIRPGGTLLYSTCTIEPKENEEVVEKFLSTHPEFSIIRPKDVPDTLITARGFVRTWPHRHRMGGSFAALLAKSPP